LVNFGKKMQVKKLLGCYSWNTQNSACEKRAIYQKEKIMFTKKFLIVLLITVVSITACAPKVEATSTSTPPTQPIATPGNCPCFEGLSSGLDNVVQARIRTVSMVMGAPNTDVYVNGMPALNGGMAQANIDAGKFSGFLYVAPGAYTIALVPHGGTLDQALFPPEDVKVEAGHRYTLAAIGQLEDKDVHRLVVDETALEASLGASVTDNIAIDINNMKGADSIIEQAYGKSYAENIKYGEVRAWFCASGTAPLKELANKGGTSEVLWEDGQFGVEPGISLVIPWFGPFPANNYDSVGNGSQGTSELNVVDFLAGFDGRDVKIDGHLATFNTFLKLIDKAGLRDQLVNSGPYFFMIPTDEAFSALSQAELDTLANDPQALINLLNAHIADGYYPFGSLSGVVYGMADREVMNRLGQSLKFYGDNLNGVPIGPNYTVGNGNRVQIIYTLLSSK
jgi:hypothetical protein